MSIFLSLRRGEVRYGALPPKAAQKFSGKHKEALMLLLLMETSPGLWFGQDLKGSCGSESPHGLQTYMNNVKQ